MTLILRISNLFSFLRKSEGARASSAERRASRAIETRGSARPSAAAQEFGTRAAADAWQYACNQRAFR